MNAAEFALGTPAALLYPEVVKSASHGLHMPAHFSLRSNDILGAYTADVSALAAADTVCRLYGRGEDLECDMNNLYHSLEYIQYEGAAIFHTPSIF
jgi:hypothetical protein